MTTTKLLNKTPIFYNTKEECLISQKNRIVSNDKYPNFFQRIFTAGDEEQFQTYRDETNGDICKTPVNIENNIFKDITISSLEWEGYHNIPASSVLDTFRYLFNKFKKGIFVKIKDNTLDVFLPFSKANYVNEWSSYIKINPKYKTLNDFIKHIYNLEGKSRYFNPNKINQFVSTWYGNNCLLRYDFPINEGDHAVAQFYDMFDILCKNRKVPDIEFFINRRDFPLLKKDFTEPYNHIYDTDNLPLLSHKYDKYSPLFSGSSTNSFADILIPTDNDWSRISSLENKFFYNEQCKDFPSVFNIPWKDKIPTAVFRGAPTGCEISIETNPRLKVVYLSTITKPDEDNIPLLDAGITKWKTRIRKLQGEKYLNFLDHTKLPFGLSNFLSYEEQSRYKYIINIDGHVSAYRLSIELNMGSVVLLVDSPYKLWYSDLLIPGFHYIPIKSDLSDLIDKIKWCKNHDKECEIITENAKKFYETYLLKDGILDYLQSLLVKTKEKIGTYLYNYLPFEIAQMNKEIELIEKSYPILTPPSNILYNIPPHPRTHSLLQGIQWAIKYLLDKKEIPFDIQLISDNIYEGVLRNIPLLTITEENMNYKSIHKLFIGINGTNNLLKEIPNFQYIFGSFTKETNNKLYIMYEKFQCVTFYDYLLSNKFFFKDYLTIISQIALISQVSLNNCSFIHGNLTPDNILLQYIPEEKEFEYVLGAHKIIKIKTKIIPIIVNYDKSSIIYDNVYYGYNPSLGQIYDILTLIYSSIKILLTKTLSKDIFDKILILANFYQFILNKPEFKTGFSLKEFLKDYDSKIQNIPFNVYPEMVFNYITRTMNLPVETSDKASYLMNIGNSNQVFDYIFSKTMEDKLYSYINVYNNIMKCSMPQSENKLLTYYISQTLYNNVNSVYRLAKQFIRFNEQKIDKSLKDKLESSYKSILNFISSVYSLKLKGINTKIEYNIHLNLNDEFLFKDKKIYENPELLINLSLFNDNIWNKKNNENLADNKEIFIKVFNVESYYSLSNIDYNFYHNNLRELLMFNTDTIRRINSIPKTIKTFSEEIYSFNIEILEKNENCPTKEKYLNYYIKILELIK